MKQLLIALSFLTVTSAFAAQNSPININPHEPTGRGVNCRLDDGAFPFAVSTLRYAGENAAYINGRLMRGYVVHFTPSGVQGHIWGAVLQPGELRSTASFICDESR